MDPELLRDHSRVAPDAGDAVDLVLVDPGIRDRVARSIEVQRQLGDVRDPPELRGLRRADDRGTGAWAHATTGPNTGTEMPSSRGSNSTWSSMSSTRCS